MTMAEKLLAENQEQQKLIEKLLKENSRFKELVKTRDLEDAQRDIKDRLFRYIFGNPENREWTLSLYNALNGTEYSDPDKIEYTTIGDAVYMRMKNDVSLLVNFRMNLWEHQSSFNPNMPMRFFVYGGRLYEKYMITSDYHEYSSSLQKIPTPICVCFYNGTDDQPERQVLRLSDAYEGDGDIEVTVTMLNINYGKNQKLMDSCKPLKEYAWLIDKVRSNQKEMVNLDAAVDAAINEMPEDYVIKMLLVANRAEGAKHPVDACSAPTETECRRNMFLADYNEEKTLRLERQEGIEQGIEQGIDQERVRVAEDMLKDGDSFSKIMRISKLPEHVISELAESMGVAVV